MNGSKVCVDASFTVKLAVREAGSDQVAQQWAEWAHQRAEVLAPELLWYEVTSTLAKRRGRGHLTDSEGSDALAALLSLDITTVRSRDLHRRAYELAREFGHTVAYDASYVSVAEQAQCPLWTADGGIATACRQIGVEAHLIS